MSKENGRKFAKDVFLQQLKYEGAASLPIGVRTQ